MSLTQLTAFITWLILSFYGGAASRILLGLPATAAHELAHWLIALLTGSKPGFPSLWPRRAENGRGWVLGSVQFVAYPRVAGFVALAPLWCLAPWAWWLVTDVSHQQSSLLYQGVLGVLAGYLVVGSIPSGQDWYIAFKYPFGLVVVLAVLAIAVRLALGL